jgi:predicted transcriptional regulator
MKSKSQIHLSRRERQIMDIIYRTGRATVAEVLDQLPDPPSYSAVRAMLRVLEEKGHLRHEQHAAAFTYLPTLPAETARRSAVKHLLQTFFGGSAERAMAALLDESQTKLSQTELDKIAQMIETARKEGR